MSDILLVFPWAFLGSSDGRVLHSSPVPKVRGHQLLRGLGFTELASRAQANGQEKLGVCR
ncbi:uncharacterized protein J3R85_004302 [Psidium guajava]|nr:uncharacterized protein J3R85_004302 [Psidium guajava]